MSKKSVRPLAQAIAIACMSIASASSFAAAKLTQSHDSVFVAPSFAATAYQVRLSGPSGLLLERAYLTEERIAFSPASWPDGDYRIEVWPILAVERDAANLAPGARAPWAPEQARFTARDGVLYLADEATANTSEFDSAEKDRLIPDDLIVRGSGCVGLDCATNEVFGFDTLRLKENNTRLKFDDTSVESGFADNDWELLANDAGSAGANKFSIRDVTGNTTPFTVLAGAPNNALFVDDAGDVGFGTSTPATRLHVQGGVGSTAVRLSDSSGTLGSVGSASGLMTSRPDDALAVRAENGLYLSGQGNATDVAIVGGEVGIGTASPSAKLTVNGDATFSGGIDGTAIGANTPSTGEFTTLSATGIDGTPIGATTPSTGEFTTLSATGIDGTPIGATTPSTGEFTTLSATGIDGTPIGATTPSTGEFTTLTVGSLEFDAIDDTPIGATTPSTGEFTTLSAAGIDGTPIGANTPSTGEFTTLTVGTLDIDAIDDTPIGSTTPSTGEFTTLSATAIDGTPIGATTPSTGAFTTLSATSISSTPFTVTSGAPSNAMFVDSTGKIGLGTSTPSGVLHIVNTHKPQLLIDNTDPDGGTRVDINRPSAAAYGQLVFATTGTAGYTMGQYGDSLFQIRSATTTSRAIVLDGSNGNVGIGTTTPSAKLHVSGDATISGGINGTSIGATTPSTAAFTTMTVGKSGTAASIGLKRTSDGVTSSLVMLSGSQLQIRNGATNETIRMYTHNGAADVLSGEFTTTGLNSAPIGATTPSTGGFTTLATSGNAGIGGATGSDFRLFAFQNASSGSAAFVARQDGAGDIARFLGASGAEKIRITSAGVIGIGTASPTTGSSRNGMVIRGNTTGTGAELLLQPNQATDGTDSGTALVAAGDDFHIANRRNGPMLLYTNNTERARFLAGGNFGIGTNNPTEKLEVNGNIKGSGNITITGTLSQGSDRNSKENFEPVDPQMVLDKLEAMDVTRWNYIADGEEVQHIGPMAQDFYAAFGLGESETKIAPVDTSGIALLAIKGLQEDLDVVRGELAQRDAEIAAMKAALQRRDAEFAALAEKLERLSGTVAAMEEGAASSAAVSNEVDQVEPVTQGL